MLMKVRRYDYHDARTLVAIRNAIQPDEPRTAASFQQHMAALEQAGGRAWIIEVEGEIAGYAVVVPLPGLPRIAQLAGGIAPARQRQGLGSHLLAHVIQALKHTGIRQLSHRVTTLEAPAARFLSRHGFTVEHEEWAMALSDLCKIPPLSMPADCRLETFGRARAIQQFCSLYDQSFGPYRWYQPYSEAEVAAALDDAANILFLTCTGRPVGFVWLHLTEEDGGEIEPIGVIPGHQGQGYGRLLLLAGLHELARRGARRVALGLWRENQAALHLYQSLGFRHQYTWTYLAYDLRATE